MRDRPFQQKLTILKRLARNRGIVYLIDYFLGRILGIFYQIPVAMPFPDINESVIRSIRNNNPCHDCLDPHSNDTLDFVKKIDPDYILLSGAPVLKPSLFGLAKYGAINWHHGLSPAYRGSDCPLWTMARNDFGNIGFTIHFVSERVDGGQIILQRKIVLKKDFEFSEALANISLKGMEGYIEVVHDIILNNKIDSKNQGRGGRHYPPAGLSTIRRAYENYKKFAMRFSGH